MPAMESRLSLTVVIAAFNEQDALPALHPRLSAVLDGDQQVRRVFGQSRLRQAVGLKQVEDRAELAGRGDANANVGCRGPCSVVRRRSGALG